MTDFPSKQECLDWAATKDPAASMQQVVGCKACPFELVLIELRSYDKEVTGRVSSYYYYDSYFKRKYNLPEFASKAITRFDLSKDWSLITFKDFIKVLKSVED